MAGTVNRKNSRTEKNNHSGIRRLFTLNIGTIIFGALLLYVIISLFIYLTATHVTSYQVTSGPLAKNQTYTGLAVRSEKVVNADTSGYVTYYARENSKVKKAGVVYGIGPGKQTDQGSDLTEDTLASLRTEMQKFSLNFDPSDYHDVYSFKYVLEGEILDNSLLSAPSATAGSSGSMTIGNETISTASADGIVSYSTDGYENFDLTSITPEEMDEKSYEVKDLKTTEKVAAGQSIYKIIDSEKWSLIIPLSSKQIVQISDRKTIRVKFLKDGATQNAAFSILTMSDGKYYGKLDFTNGLLRYIDSRFIDIELVTNNATGLKIPVTSVVNKEFYTIPDEYATKGGDSQNIGFLKLVTDSKGNESTKFTYTTLYEHKNNKYYIDSSDLTAGDIIVKDGTSSDRYIIKDTDTLEGVYSMNKGYALFRKISIIDKNEEYCIDEKGTSFGLSQFDYIVLNSSKVKESDITAK